MSLLVINFIMFAHWIGDFLLQKNKKKTRKKIKNKNLKHLLPHTLIYTIVLTLSVLILQFINKWNSNLILFFFITYITHFVIDLLITKINEKNLKKNDRHKYFLTIGIDQFIHYSILFATIYYLYH